MKPLLILAQPRTTPAAARTSVRLATGGSPAALGLGGVGWDAAVVRRPRLSIELLSPSLDGRIQTGRGDLVINLGRVKQHPDVQSYYWNGSPIVIYDAGNLDFNNMPIEFNGVVREAQMDLDNNQLTLNLEVSVAALEKPLLYTDFSGGTGLGGLPEQAGTPKPAGFGAVKNIEPVWIDTARNIGMIDGYGNTLTIDALFEGASDFGARVADYATFNALAAAIDTKVIAPGRWGTCVASGLVGLGAPPVAPITVDATFGFNRPGSLITRLLTQHAGISSGLIDSAAFTALTAAVNRPVHYWTAQQREVKDLVEAIAASCNATMLLTFQNVYSVTRAFGGANIATVDRAKAGSPRWTKWRPLDADTPTWRMKARAARPGVTLTSDQILYEDDIIDRGLYSATETYRLGNVTWNAAGAQFVYINTTPAAGAPLPVLPAVATTFWEQTKPAPAAGDLFYADGTPIEALKPAAPGSTRNDDGANMIPSPVNLDQMTLGTGAIRSVTSSTGRPADRYRLQLINVDGAFAYLCPPIPCQPGEVLYYQHAVTADATSPDKCNASFTFYGADGVTVVTGANGGELGPYSPNTTLTGAEAVGGWKIKGVRVVVPAGVAFIRPYPERKGAAGVMSFFIGEPYLSRSQPGADVTAIPDGPAQSTVFNYSYDYIPEAGVFPRDLTWKMVGPFGAMTTGITGTWRVTSGSVNGITPTNGAQAFTSIVNGLCTLAVTALGTDANAVEVTLSYNGVPKTKSSILSRQRGDAPAASTGGSSGTVASKNSGFTAFSATTPTDVTGNITFTMPAGKTTANVVVSMLATPSVGSADATRTVTAKVQRDIAGTFTDQGAAMTGTSENDGGFPGGPGEPSEPASSTAATLSGTIVMTGLTAGASYTVRVVMASSAVKTHYPSGSVTVTV